jgi:hypothetical protein
LQAERKIGDAMASGCAACPVMCRPFWFEFRLPCGVETLVACRQPGRRARVSPLDIVPAAKGATPQGRRGFAGTAPRDHDLGHLESDRAALTGQADADLAASSDPLNPLARTKR